MFLIDSIGLDPQSAVTLYIYRVGKTYPARNLVYRSKSIKNSNYSRIPPRPVGPTGQTGRAPAGSATAPDRLIRPVRPVDANFSCQQVWYPVGKAQHHFDSPHSTPKSISCFKKHVTTHPDTRMVLVLAFDWSNSVFSDEK